jgi:miniconductance mechanosensitive channel
MVIDWVEKFLHVSDSQAQVIAVSFLFIFAFVLYLLISKVVLFYIAKISKQTKMRWDDFLVQRRFFHRMSYIPSLIIIYHTAGMIPNWTNFIVKVTQVLMIWFLMNAVTSLLHALNDIYMLYEVSKTRPIKGYLQIVNIFFFIIGLIGIISIVIGKSPWLLMSGLGAMTAILILVFKDTILSFIAGLQITLNDLFRIGDWLEIPDLGADGDVIDIALHTVQIQNWDKTISVIPTHKLIEGTFKNWRGMQQAGGRRIKRAIHIDISSVRFCDDAMIEKFKHYQILHDYIEQKEKEIQKYNEEHHIDTSELVNGRRMTNIGTFRAYIEAYLLNHPKINHELTFLIRQLAPDSQGLPIEIYVFTNDTRWAFYEKIQADIFDHLLAIVPEFGLRVFQAPTGYNLEHIRIEATDKIFLH